MKSRVAQCNMLESASDLGWQESQSSLYDDESESEPEIVEVTEDGLEKADLPPSMPVCEDDLETVDLPPSMPECEFITTCESSVAGKASVKVQWRINHFSERMNRARGRPLVSPDFSAGELAGLRLAVAPESQNSKVSKSERSLQAFKTLVTTGPFSGCLTLKTQNAPQSPLEYYISIKDQTRGPFTNDFSEKCSATHEGFGIDWLQGKNVDGSLLIGIEIVLPVK